MTLFKSFIISFSMYSSLPMPKVEWDKESMCYTFIFFPWIGLVIGGIDYLLLHFTAVAHLSPILSAVILTLIPIFLSGGIHMDGLIDTCDAIFSFGDRQKRLEILKDPRTGAFGVLGCGICLLLLFGVFSQLIEAPKFGLALLLLFTISRSAGALLLLVMPKAKAEGLAHIFSVAAYNKPNVIVLSIYLFAAFGWLCTINLVLGASIGAALLLYIALFIKYMMKNFFGITGDLIGFFITSLEVLLLGIIAIGGLL